MRRNSVMSTPTYWPTWAISPRSSSILSVERSISACQPRPRLFAHFAQPVRVKFTTTVGVDKFTAVDAGLVSQFHHRAVDGHDTAVDAVKLVNQRLDPVVVQVKRIHQFSQFRSAVFDISFLLFSENDESSFKVVRHTRILHIRQLGKVTRNHLERFKNARLKCGFHCGK